MASEAMCAGSIPAGGTKPVRTMTRHSDCRVTMRKGSCAAGHSHWVTLEITCSTLDRWLNIAWPRIVCLLANGDLAVGGQPPGDSKGRRGARQGVDDGNLVAVTAPAPRGHWADNAYADD